MKVAKIPTPTPHSSVVLECVAQQLDAAGDRAHEPERSQRVDVVVGQALEERHGSHDAAHPSTGSRASYTRAPATVRQR